MRTARSYQARQREREHMAALAEKLADEQGTKADASGVFQIMPLASLIQAASGHLDLNGLAIDELVSRGLDPNTGAWVGFDTAAAIGEKAKAALGVL
jgi:hypothetical protein